MATPYIKSHTGARRNRKVIAFAKALRIHELHALGHLHGLWYQVLEQQDDGDLTHWSEDMIAGFLEVASKPAPQLVRLLLDVGLMGYRDPVTHEVIPGTERLIHDWIDYAGDYLRGRYAGRNREKLVAIWAKHGRDYGNPMSTDSQPFSNHNNPTSANQPANHNGGGSGRKAEQKAKILAELRGGP